MRKKIVVVGGNFGGLTAALTLKKELTGEADVTVVSTSDRFLFTPSLIWVPFGLRRPAFDRTWFWIFPARWARSCRL